MTETFETHYRKLENMYHTARVNQFFTSTLNVANGTSTINLPVQEEYFHGFGSVHGSVFFKLLDDAAYFAAASEVTDRCIVTVSFSVQLIKSANRGTLTAEGHLISNSGRILVAEAQIVDDTGDLVAIGHGTFSKTGMALRDVATY